MEPTEVLAEDPCSLRFKRNIDPSSCEPYTIQSSLEFKCQNIMVQRLYGYHYAGTSEELYTAAHAMKAPCHGTDTQRA